MAIDSLLFHLGLHKTATSSLQKSLFKPEFGFAQFGTSEQVLDMFVDKGVAQGLAPQEHRQIADFTEQCKAADLVPVVSHERLSGYPISGGYDRVSIRRRIASLAAPVKVLLVIREQKAWLYSAWKQMIVDGGDVSLQDFLAPKTLPNVRIPPPRLDYLDYATEISDLHASFGKENVCVLPMEAIGRDWAACQQQLARFLGHDSPVKMLDDLPRQNESRPMSAIYLTWLLNKLLFSSPTAPGGLLPLHKAGSFRLFVRLRDALRKLPEMPMRKQRIARHKALIESTVGSYYANSNAQTADLIGIDLGQYGYCLPSG